jgi:dihydroorotate dehydrogenase
VYRQLRPLLFRLDAEAAHRVAMLALRLGGPFLSLPKNDPCLAKEILGIRFPNPVGLAAGFDKYAEAVGQWQKLGFGFCEIGSFTRHPQAGNDRPRVWRYPESSALINRFGFNNPGADEVALRLARLRKSGNWPQHPVGINIGKSKISPEDEAIEDYLYSFEKLESFADYIAVNVSSPNTPGLRNLQAKGKIKKLVGALTKQAKRSSQAKPIFVKFAPDLSDKDLFAACDGALAAGAKGLIISNTTLSREGLGKGPHPEGGMSGAPLLKRADQCLKALAKHTQGRVPLIGVGGIMTAEEAAHKLELGASLIQIYTGFIYQGPGFPGQICLKLTKNCG